jgi:hypothetical protein
VPAPFFGSGWIDTIPTLTDLDLRFRIIDKPEDYVIINDTATICRLLSFTYGKRGNWNTNKNWEGRKNEPTETKFQ